MKRCGTGHYTEQYKGRNISIEGKGDYWRLWINGCETFPFFANHFKSKWIAQVCAHYRIDRV